MEISWLTLVLIVWAVTTTVFAFSRNPLPFPDRGHRGFGVKDLTTAKTVKDILERHGQLTERFTFDSGPTHQTLYWDNTTVIMTVDKEVRQRNLPLNFISLPVRDPKTAATEAADELKKSGVTARVHENINPDLGDKLVMVDSPAFDGWVLIFRKHVLKMGKLTTRRLGKEVG